jgi:Uma2 family endonuclease
LSMPPAGSEHGALGMKFGFALGQVVYPNNLGELFNSDTGFRIASNPDTVRAADLAFIRRERIPESGLPQGFWPGAPDLAVEVISPSDRYTEVQEKAGHWLDAGTRMVIVIDPRIRTVMVYSSSGEAVRLTESGVIDGGDVVPGFSYPVAELFR